MFTVIQHFSVNGFSQRGMPDKVEQRNGPRNEKRNYKMHVVDQKVVRIMIKFERTCLIDDGSSDAK